MILLTVGTQLPFDRFVRIVDGIAAARGLDVTAQIGRGRYAPRHMRWERTIEPIAFERMFAGASLILSHAGIGTLVMAQRHLKPIVLFPRRGALEEHRNDHQVATVNALAGRAGVHVAHDAAGLEALLAAPLAPPPWQEAHPERDRLNDGIRTFIAQARAAHGAGRATRIG